MKYLLYLRKSLYEFKASVLTINKEKLLVLRCRWGLLTHVNCISLLNMEVISRKRSLRVLNNFDCGYPSLISRLVWYTRSHAHKMYRLCECDTVFWIHLIWVKAVIKPSQLLLHWSSVTSNYLPLIDETWATNV